MKTKECSTWEVRYKGSILGYGSTFEAAADIAYPHDAQGFPEPLVAFGAPIWCTPQIVPLCTDYANNYFADRAREYFMEDEPHVDLSTLIRVGRWLDRGNWISVDDSGRIWADNDMYIGRTIQADEYDL